MSVSTTLASNSYNLHSWQNNKQLYVPMKLCGCSHRGAMGHYKIAISRCGTARSTQHST
jgi:hypothetical protein